ncbi:hypothetical protein [Burkholderia ubonensis]|uniref:hypothetical protein n=1 Tax=Burkholderia ubonensis TaxID=101571 RepID=UPI001E512C0D|nr:hypothetical protein [Burkholderia ubonensis]
MSGIASSTRIAKRQASAVKLRSICRRDFAATRRSLPAASCVDPVNTRTFANAL